MVASSITALIVMIVFALYLGFVFFIPILELLINGILIYAMFLRSYTEIKKEKKHNFYIGGSLCAVAVFFISGNFLSKIYVWSFTTFLVLLFAFAQAGLIIKFLEDKYAKHTSYNK